MDIHKLRVHDLLALNKATHGDLHDALAAAWDTYDSTDVDIQLSYLRGDYTIHITGLIGDGVVYDQSILVRGDRTLGEAQRILLLLLWIDCIQSRTARALTRADAVVARFVADRDAGRMNG
jgi:hypothetical protein